MSSRRSCRRGPCAWCGAPGRRRRAGGSRPAHGSAGPAAAPRCGSRPGSSRRSRCPAAGSARRGGRRAAGAAGSCASPPGPDSRSTALPMTACSRAAQAAVVPPRAGPSPPRRSWSSSTHSRTRSSSASTLTSPVTMGAIAASHAIASAASPSSHAPSVAPVSDGVRAAGGPPGPDLLRPLLLQRRVAVEQEQVGQGDMRPGLDRLPGPLRQQAAGGQRPHRLGQRVVVPLPLGPVVLLPGRRGQRVQHRGDRGGALGGQVAVQDPGPADRGGQLHLAVRELPARVLIGQIPPGPHVHLREQRRQVRQPQPAGEGGQQLLIRRVPVLLRAACRSTGRSAARRTRRPARRPAPPAPSGAWRPAWPRRCARRRRRG